MLLAQHINKYCPKVSHVHSKGDSNLDASKCILCTQNISDFTWKCNLYFKMEPLEDIKIMLLRKIFTESIDFFLPIELQDIIIKYSTVKKYMPIKLDKYGINHMLNCYICSRKFLLWLNKNTCNQHMLPRLQY